MIAVVEEKYKGVKTLEPDQGPKGTPERLNMHFDAEDMELIRQTLEEGIQYVDNPMFHDRDSAKDISSDLKEGPKEPPNTQAKLIPIELFEEGEQGVNSFESLSQKQETELFLKLNYCRYRIYKILSSRADKDLTITSAEELVTWKRRELHVRAQLTQANIPLVLAMAKRSKPNGVDFSELISEGNMALLRSIDKFDCSRGFKFSTYACRAILKSFSRAAQKMTRYRGRFPVGFDPELEKGDDIEIKREDRETHCVDTIRDILSDRNQNLSDVERQVLRARFAIADKEQPNEGPMTLEQVGEIIGVTKERVRQIQNKALAKLRDELEESVLSG